jgi:hypothetical protein
VKAVIASILFTLALSLVGACGDNLPSPGPLAYTDPGAGKLRLVKDPASTGWEIVLDLVVGDAPQTGYSVGFDLPLTPGDVQLGAFTPGTALAAGTAPVAALASIPDKGPLANQLVTGQSQKASGGGAVATDTTLAPGSILYSIHMAPVVGARAGIVFDGTASGFVLASGGLRDRKGNTVVDAKDVAIGKLELVRDDD